MAAVSKWRVRLGIRGRSAREVERLMSTLSHLNPHLDPEDGPTIAVEVTALSAEAAIDYVTTIVARAPTIPTPSRPVAVIDLTRDEHAHRPGQERRP